MTSAVFLFRNKLPRAQLIFYFALSFGSSCLQCNEFGKFTYATLMINQNIERGFNYFHTHKPTKHQSNAICSTPSGRINTKSDKKSSNFSYKQTKALYQNNKYNVYYSVLPLLKVRYKYFTEITHKRKLEQINFNVHKICLNTGKIPS